MTHDKPTMDGAIQKRRIKIKQIILSVLESHTQEMEGYSYCGSNPGVSRDDYEDIADSIIKSIENRILKGELE